VVEDDTSIQNFFSLNLTFSFGKDPSRKTLIPTLVDKIFETIPYAEGYPYNTSI